jgi:hypothetical protein
MDPQRFDTLVKILSAPGNRRGIVRLLAALPLGMTLAASRGDKTALAEGPVAAAPQRVAVCSPVLNDTFSTPGNPRYAASFAPLQSGKLSRIEISLDKDEGSSGDFVVKLLNVDPGNGFPGTKVLASKKVRNDRVRPGEFQTLVASFKKRHGFKLVQGTTYAVVISRPNADASGWRVRVGENEKCIDTRFFFTGQPSAGFLEPGGGIDLLFSVFVGF